MQKISANRLKIMLWASTPNVYISTEMLETKSSLGEQDGNRVVINPKIESIHEFLGTFVHELLHMILPDYEEDQILQFEKKVMHSMSSFEKVQLLIKFAKHLKKVEN